MRYTLILNTNIYFFLKLIIVGNYAKRCILQPYIKDCVIPFMLKLTLTCVILNKNKIYSKLKSNVKYNKKEKYTYLYYFS